MTKNKKYRLYDYLDYVKMAKLDCKSKALLYFYATSYNWSENKPSWYSQRTICALTSMAQSTYHSVQKKLERLRWIRTNNRGRDKSVQVWVSVGESDPEYDSFSWATWHPYNSEEAELEDYVHDPVEHRDRQETPFNSPSTGSNRRQDDQAVLGTRNNQFSAIEEFWRAFEDPHAPVSPLAKIGFESSETEPKDLASEIWGV